jgi:hypothetical protein
MDRPMTPLNRDREPRPILADISVVIPTLGRAILQQSLEHILSGSAWPRSIIVVDQGQKEEISRWLGQIRELQIDAQYIPSTERGKSAALNRGIAEVTTRGSRVAGDRSRTLVQPPRLDCHWPCTSHWDRAKRRCGHLGGHHHIAATQALHRSLLRKQHGGGGRFSA